MQEIKNLTDYKLSLCDRILDTAIKDFVRRGVKAVKMDDIAAALGISKRTLYELYDTKEQVILEGLKRHHRLKDEELAVYAQNLQHDVLDIIIFIYRRHINDAVVLNPAFYDDVSKYPQIVDYLKEQNRSRQQDFIRFMQRGVDEGFLRSEINYQTVPHLLDAVGQYVMNTQMLKKYPADELFDNLFLVSLRGLCTIKGYQLLEDAIATKIR